MIINGKEYNRDNLGKIFDYAYLDHNKSEKEIIEHVKRGIEYNVNGIHCNPTWLELIAEMLEGTGIETGVCPAFPFGTLPLDMKMYEVETMLKKLRGRPAAVDFVINVGYLRGGQLDKLKEEAVEMVKLGKSYGATVKSIMENQMLTDEQLAIGCRIMSDAGVDYVKCASGRGGSPEMRTVFIMRNNIRPDCKIKYSGYGTYNLTQLTIMGLASGCTLFGNEFAHRIIEEIEENYKNLVIDLK